MCAEGHLMNISPYLNFDGQTEEAMTFYAQALGGKLTEIHRFGTMPGSETMPEAFKKQGHARWSRATRRRSNHGQ